MKKRVTMALLFSAIFGTFFITPLKSQQAPEVYMKFPNGTGSSVNEYYVCNTFNVSIVVNSPDIGIWSWSAGIHFNSTLLECTNFGEGDFFDGHYTLGFIGGTINNTLGYVTFSGNSLRDPETTGVNGTGVLMWFEFHVIGCGNCILNLTDSPPDLQCGVKLNQRVDSSVFRIDPIVLTDGSFANTESVELPVPKGGNATIASNVTVTNARVTPKVLQFEASGPSGSTGWINVTFPMVNNSEIKVKINNEWLKPPPFPIITANETHYFIYFEFNLSTHNITILYGMPVGGIWIPVNKLELLTPWIGLASTVVLAILATAILVKFRKKRSRVVSHEKSQRR